MAEWFKQISSAIGGAHQNGTVHPGRQIPSNGNAVASEICLETKTRS